MGYYDIVYNRLFMNFKIFSILKFWNILYKLPTINQPIKPVDYSQPNVVDKYDEWSFTLKRVPM